MFSRWFKKQTSAKKPSLSGVYNRPRVSLEIDSGCIKVVQMRLKRGGKIVVDKAAVCELKYFKFEEVPHIIAEFLKKNGINKRHVISCFPRNLSTIRFMNLPSTDAKELNEMVAFQAIKQVPYSKEDMIADYEVISLTHEGYSNVMIVIVRRNVICQHLDAIESAGFVTDRIDINSQAILRTYLFLKGLEEKTEEQPPDSPRPSPDIATAVALVDVDYTHTNIQIMNGDTLLFSRGIPLGVMHLILKEKKFQVESANINWQSELMDELSRSFAVFSREQSTVSIGKIVLSGGINNFHHIERNIRSRFLVPVEVLNLTEKIAGLAAFNGALKINDKEVSLMAPVGLLLPGYGRTIDMIPEDEKEHRKNRLRMAKAVVAASLLAGIILTGMFNFYVEISRKNAFITDLNNKLNEVAPKVKKLESMRTKISIIEGQVRQDRMSLDFLRELYRVIPDKICLTAFLYDESKYIVIKGTANTMADVFDLIPKLEESDYFEKVSSRGVKRRKVGDKEVVDFEIQCPLVREEAQG